MAIAVTPKYIREGKCNRCGFCCLGGDKNQPCEYLEWDGEIAVCKVYGEHPQACKSFPEAPPILTGKCGYYFIDTWIGKTLGVKEV